MIEQQVDPGTAADQPEKEEQHQRERPPKLVIDAGIAGAGHDRRDIEQRLAERMLDLVAVEEDPVQRDHRDQNCDDDQEHAHLRIAQQRLRRAREQLHKAHERQAGQHHEDRGDVFRHALEHAERRVIGRKPACRDGRQRMVEGVE